MWPPIAPFLVLSTLKASIKWEISQDIIEFTYLRSVGLTVTDNGTRPLFSWYSVCSGSDSVNLLANLIITFACERRSIFDARNNAWPHKLFSVAHSSASFKLPYSKKFRNLSVISSSLKVTWSLWLLSASLLSSRDSPSDSESLTSFEPDDFVLFNCSYGKSSRFFNSSSAMSEPTNTPRCRISKINRFQSSENDARFGCSAECMLDIELLAERVICVEFGVGPTRICSKQKSMTCLVWVAGDNGPGNVWYKRLVWLFCAIRINDYENFG